VKKVSQKGKSLEKFGLISAVPAGLAQFAELSLGQFSPATFRAVSG
jgi:hypothetical protein